MAAVLSIDTTTNQRLAAMGGRGVADETQPRRNAWGGLFPVVLRQLMGRWKRERGGTGLGLERLPLAKPTQQPAENSTSDGATWRGSEGSAIALILGRSSWEKVKKWNKPGGTVDYPAHPRLICLFVSVSSDITFNYSAKHLFNSYDQSYSRDILVLTP